MKLTLGYQGFVHQIPPPPQPLSHKGRGEQTESLSPSPTEGQLGEAKQGEGKVNRIKQRDWLTLALILFVAAMVRLGEPGMVEFKLDEAWVSRITLDWLDGGALPLTGMPSSVGVPNPPVSVYLLAIPFALSSNPLVATMFIAALNIVGVGLLWLIAHRYINRDAALAAGFAYALSPWAVLYSRKIWAQDMHTSFVLLAVLLGLLGFREGKRWAQALCLPVLILALQIHFAAWALLPVYLVLLWMGGRRVSWRAVLVSVALAALTLLPYLVGLAQTLQADPNRLSNAVGNGGGIGLTADALRYTAELTTGLGVAEQVAPEQAGELLAAVPPQPQLWAVLGALALIGLLALWLYDTRLCVLTGAWALVPLVVFSVAWTPVYPHYFVASIPAYALLIGVGLAWLIRRAPGKPFSRVVLLTAFAAILLTQGVWWRGMLRYVDTHEVTGFGTPLYRLLPLRDYLLQHEDVLLLVDDARLAYSEEPAVWTVLLHEAECVRALAGTDMILLPDGAFAAAAAPGSSDALVDVYKTDDPLRAEIAPERAYKVYEHDAAPALDLPEFNEADARFSNGVTLTGYAIEEGRIVLAWTLAGSMDADYHTFVHLLDANGERIAQQDAPFLAERYGCAGDRLITTTTIDVPDAARTLRVGMYVLDGERITNADVLDEAGNAAASWADLPLRNDENS